MKPHPKRSWLEGLFAGHHDVLAALRSLRRSPGFVAIAVLSLGLAIGLNTTMLSMIDAIIDPYVPYAQPQQLADLIPYGITRDHEPLQRTMYLAARARTDLYAQIVPWTFEPGTMEANGHLVSALAFTVGTRLFDVLGVKPVLGRTFETSRDDPADATAAVISYQVWQEDFGGNRDLGRLHLDFDGRTYSVIGVMPPAVYYPMAADFWLAMPRSEETSADGSALIRALVRLKPGDTPARVGSQLNALAGRIAAEHHSSRARFAYRLRLLSEGHGHPAGSVIAAAVVSLLVLLVACLNLANLMLVRGLSRRREVAVRRALGASRAAIMRHVFAEAGVLATLGGGLGVLLSLWGVELATGHLPTTIRELGFVTPQVSWRVVLVGVLVTAATVIVAGLAPALNSAGTNVSAAMKDGSGSSTPRRAWAYRAVVAGEIAVALVVMIGATFAMEAWRRESLAVFPYDAAHVVSGGVILRKACHTTTGPGRFWEDMTQRVASVPGVTAAAAYMTAYSRGNVLTSDQPGIPLQTLAGANGSLGYTVATSGYFRTLGFPIVAGRDFQPGDAVGTGKAIVNRRLARELWPLVSPVGRLLKLGPVGSNAPWVEVVGVVGPARATPDSLFDGTPELTITRPLACQSATIAARLSVTPAVGAMSVYHAVQAAIPAGSMVGDFRSPKEGYNEGLRVVRLSTVMSIVFGIFSVLLSAVGVYGVLGYAVGQRLREFAMRTALGARRPDIAGIVVREALEMVLGGTALGGTAALLIAYRVFQAAHGVEGAVALVVAEAVVVIASLAACIVPIRRATRADPVDLLRAT